MKYKKGKIKGVVVVKLRKFSDYRGVLIETYRTDVLPRGVRPVMSYVSFTKPGVSRGPHEHKYQTDVFAFVGPGVFELHLWDNRENSRTYLNKMVLKAGKGNLATVIVPPGIVHGYKNVSKENGMVLNFPDKLFGGVGKKEKVDEIRHEDKGDDFYIDFVK
ncbi:MAG: dTDP-4-dehydrorhamnose 3,5-epimerase family protein [Elusimicrobia bacterium]|nr:dTDP-4-dehydrorhamnose 3,5-epimerase family protein [Elusimicrobiota bacterium]